MVEYSIVYITCCIKVETDGKQDFMNGIKKRIASMLVMCNIFLLLTGCTNQIPEMTEAQNMLITEYAAGLLLKYHADYEGRLVDTSVPPEEKPVVQEMPVQDVVSDNSIEENPIEDSALSSDIVEEVEKPSMTIAQVIGVDGFDITYRGFEMCDNYPSAESSQEELFFSMKAGQGNKLLVLKFDVTNVAAQENMLDTLSKTELDCKILINGSKTQRAYVSMLENDFMAISRNFAVGESYEAVVVTEMPEADAQSVTTVELQLKNGERETKINSLD